MMITDDDCDMDLRATGGKRNDIRVELGSSLGVTFQDLETVRLEAEWCNSATRQTEIKIIGQYKISRGEAMQ